MIRLKRDPSQDSLMERGARSEYKKRYPEYPVQKTESFRPIQQPVRGTDPVESETTTRRDYPPHDIRRTENYKPKNAAVSTDVPLDSETVTRRDYPVREIQPKPLKEKVKWNPPVDPFDGSSTNMRDFPQHEISPRVDHRPNNRPVQSDVPFEGHSDYAEKFKEYPIEPRVAKKKEEYVRPTVPFDDSTTQKNSFKGDYIPVRETMKPQYRPIHSDEPFDSTTGYTETYKAHEVTPRKAREKEVYQASTIPMDTKTTNSDAYLGAYEPKRDSFRPNYKPIASDVPFDDTTTMQRDFHEYDVQRPSKHQPEAYRRPDGAMDLNTTNSIHYKQLPLEKQTMKKPSSSNLLRGEGKMSNDTNYQGDFVEHSVERRQNMRPEHFYKPPEDPMEVNTTNRTDFFDKGLVQRENYRPSNVAVMSDIPFDGSTGYRDTFTSKELPPRAQRQRDVYKEPTIPFESSTTVRDSFKGNFQKRRSPFKPDQSIIKSDIPFDSSTTMNNDFKQYMLPERNKYQPEPYQKPDGVMDLTTTNTLNFKQHELQKQNMVKPSSSNILKGFGEMQKTSNYQGDFRQPPSSKRELVKAKHDYQPPTDVMETSTTNKASYTEKEIRPRMNYRPTYSYQKPKIPLDTKTGYADTFTEHEITLKPIQLKESYQPPTIPLETRTTNKDSYLGAYQAKRDNFKPNQTIVKADIPMDTTTTSGLTFKQWDVARREPRVREEYRRPDGYMDLTTMNREHYKEVYAERTKPQRLTSSHMLSFPGKFENKTSYSGDYIPKSLDERKLVKQTNDYNPPSIPFNPSTENRSQFVGYVAPKEKSMKPSSLRSDTLGQRDQTNPYHIREQFWNDFINSPKAPETVA